MLESTFLGQICIKAGKYWHTASKYARIRNVSVKSGSKLAEKDKDSIRRYGRIRAFTVKSAPKLAGRIGILPGSMLKSFYLRLHLDQNWLGSIGTLPRGLLESQKSRSNLDQNWLKGMGWFQKVCYNHAILGQIWIKLQVAREG